MYSFEHNYWKVNITTKSEPMSKITKDINAVKNGHFLAIDLILIIHPITQLNILGFREIYSTVSKSST